MADADSRMSRRCAFTVYVGHYVAVPHVCRCVDSSLAA